MGARIPVKKISIPDRRRARMILARTGFDEIFAACHPETLDADIIAAIDFRAEQKRMKDARLGSNRSAEILATGSSHKEEDQMPEAAPDREVREPADSDKPVAIEDIPAEECDLVGDGPAIATFPMPDNTSRGQASNPDDAQGRRSRSPRAVLADAEADTEQDDAEEVDGVLGDGARGVMPSRDLALDDHFVCLGHDEEFYYFYPHRKGQVVRMRASMMREAAMCELADYHIWEEMFAQIGPRGGRSMNWSHAASYLIRRSQEVGVFDPRRVSGLGCWRAGESILCHFGNMVYIPGEGLLDIAQQSVYQHQRFFVRTVSRKIPDFSDILVAGSEDSEAFYDLINALHWRQETAGISALSLIGWIALAPICGVVNMRPFLWLHGPNESGKTWILKTIVLGVLGDFCINASPTTPPHVLRRFLHQSALPVVVDMADFNSAARVQLQKFDDFVSLARQSCDDVTSDSLHFEPGHGSSEIQQINTRAAFAFASKKSDPGSGIDMTGAVRAGLGASHDYHRFMRDIAVPADRIITEAFSARFLARMITRASDYDACYRIFMDALGDSGCMPSDRKLFAAICAGAWLLLESDVPETIGEANAWLSRRFGNIAEQSQIAMRQDIPDWRQAFDRILSRRITITGDGERGDVDALGNLVQIACGVRDASFSAASPAQAYRMLELNGIRITNGDGVALSPKRSGRPVYLAIHPNSTDIADALRPLGFDQSYTRLLEETPGGMKSPRTCRFAALGSTRPTLVPITEVIPGVFDEDTEA